MQPSSNSLPVVVVDDQEDAASALTELLNMSGHSARFATTGDKALILCEESPTFCVLLDVRMPGMDGVELSRRLRQRYDRDIILIAMTGIDESSQQHSEILQLVDYFLPKPIDFTRLMKILAPLGN